MFWLKIARCIMSNKPKYYSPVLNILIFILFFCAALISAFLHPLTEMNQQKEFRSDNLNIPIQLVPLNDIIQQLPNTAIWENYILIHNCDYIYIDPRSGRPSSIICSEPVIPGSGSNNNITMHNLSRMIKKEIASLNEDTIKNIVLQFLNDHAELINIAMNEIAEIKVAQPTEFLWQIFIKRNYKNITVRDSNISITINHGNVAVWGLEKWGNIDLQIQPMVAKESVPVIAAQYTRQPMSSEFIIETPHLEIIPIRAIWSDSIGTGYEHALVWVFKFVQMDSTAQWEMLI